MTDSGLPALYRLGRKSALWAEFTLSPHGLRRTWQLSISARGRGGKMFAPLLETGILRPLAAVTLKGETFPLTIDWHDLRRGGQLCLGGKRKLGLDGVVLEWEMRWVPLAGEEGAFRVEMRLRTLPRRAGALRIILASPLHRPELWSGPTAAEHCAGCAWSAYHGYFLGVSALDGTLDVSDDGGFALDLPTFSLGGGKLVTFSLRFGAAKTLGAARAALVTQYAAFAGPSLHPLDAVPALNPAAVVARLTAPEAYQTQGMERLYLKPPGDSEADTFYAGWPHEPAGALAALWHWNRLHTVPEIPRLVRFGARGLCADFQIMGRAGEPEPNKGAFWDKRTGGAGSDHTGGLTHGLRSQARLARNLLQIHEAAGEPLLLQSGLNICQWLLLKQNEAGFYDGAQFQATRGLEGDGRAVPLPCALDGAETIRAFVLAYRASNNDVWIKAAWKVAEFLLGARGQEFEDQSPAAVAGVVLSLAALDREAPNGRLQAALHEWGAWLLSLPLSATLPSLNPDGLHAGLYDCAQAGFVLWALFRDMTYLRYAFAALSAIPAASQAASWRAVTAHQSALLSLTALLPDSQIDFDAPAVTLDWRVFTPDPAAAPFLRVTPAGGPDARLDWLPLVCRATDQLLLLLIAPPDVEAAAVWKNGKRPLLKDLRTGLVDTDAPLAFPGKERWARVGVFTVDP